MFTSTTRQKPVKLLVRWKAKLPRLGNGQQRELYAHIDRLPLSNFIIALTTHKHNVLVISGSYTAAELQTAWDAIYYQYLQTTWRPAGTDYYLQLQADEALLRDEVLAVEVAMYYLSPALATYAAPYYDRIAKGLLHYGYKIPHVDAIAGGDYTPVIERLNNKLIPKRLKLDGLKRELTAYYTKHDKEAPVTAQDFYAILRKLSKYMGYAIRANDVTVAEYNGYLNDYITELEARQRQNV